MKKFVSVLTLTAMLMTIVTCAAGAEDAGSTATVGTLDEPEDLEFIIDDQVYATIDEIAAECEALTQELDTFDKYAENKDKVDAFYDKVVSATEALCIDLRAYSVDYARLILAHDASNEEKCNLLHHYLCEQILIYYCPQVYDLYETILPVMYDAYFEGIISDANEAVPYSDWSAARSAELSNWSFACSAVLSELSDCCLDIFGFWSELTGRLTQDDVDGARDTTDAFQNDVEELAEKPGHSIVWHVTATSQGGDVVGAGRGDSAMAD